MTIVDKHSEAADLLRASEDYRVLRRIQARERFSEDDGSPKKIGIILDVETTGLDPAKCEIIELGMVMFEFSTDGRIFRVLDTFNRLRQPSAPIPVEISELTGITDEMVLGHSIDPSEVAEFLESAAVVIAHNAKFDRQFAERFSPCFVPKAWACSVTEIDWRREGYEGSRLGYLLMGAGLFHSGHRAVEDCHALLEVLSRPLPKSGELALKRLLDTARRATVRVRAEYTPYETKDTLKARGYRWNGGDDGKPRCWWKDVPEDLAEAELTYLRKEIYFRDADILTVRITTFDRFSDRI